MSSVENQEHATGVSNNNTVNTDENMELTRFNVENCNKIRETDRDDETGATLYCYINCNDSDTDFVKQCRGLVFHGDNLIFKGFGYTPEFTHLQVDQIKEKLGDFTKWTAYDAYEGAVIRLFHFSGRWYLSTHRKLDAFRSKWASRKSFGTMFKEALNAELEENKNFEHILPQGDNILDQFESMLDKDKQYMFLLCNNSENRIVCKAPERPRVYHVGTFINGELDMSIDCGIPYPVKREFTSVEDMCTQVGEKVDPSYMQGLCLFGPNNQQIKVLHAEYDRLFKVRGNVPSIKFRYLEVRMNAQMVNELYNLYPEYSNEFDQYESSLYEIAQDIYNSYVKRFIHKEYVTVPRQKYTIIQECHNWHKATTKRVTLEKVITVLNKQSATNLNQMIKNLNIKKMVHPTRLVRGSRDNSPMINSQNRNTPTVLNLPPPRI